LSKMPEIMENIGIYIHIPFCLSKCPYCHFYSIPYSEEKAKDLLNALMIEIAKKRNAYPSATVDTIYLGGGTPSLLSPEEVRRIINGVKENFLLSEGAEITLEANPDDLNEKKLEGYLTSGVNRLSIGIQSFIDEELSLMGRRYGGKEGEEAFFSARRAGFSNINLDLIVGFPGGGRTNLKKTLEKAIALFPEHISAYLLELNNETRKKWEKLLPSEDEVAELYLMGVEIITSAGYNHYEISNFAREGYRSGHNLKYWEDKPYLGFGPSASSYDLSSRFTNCPDLSRYLKAMSEGRDCLSEKVKLSEEKRAKEALIMGLRKREGVEIESFKERYGMDLSSLPSKLSPFFEEGLLEFAKGRLRLTLRGVLLSNEVFQGILSL